MRAERVIRVVLYAGFAYSVFIFGAVGLLAWIVGAVICEATDLTRIRRTGKL